MRKRRTKTASWLLGIGCLLVGCGGAGEGQISGTLFMRGCPPRDPTPEGSSEVPTPLPPFSLEPRYFFGEVIRSLKQGLSNTDPRGIDRLRIRLQSDSGKIERSDTFEMLVYDLDRFPQVQAAALARGERGVPIVPPALDDPQAPLPSDPAASVRASIALNVTCWFPRVKPLLRGYVYFSALGRTLGEEVSGELAVTVEDARATREQGDPPPVPDAAGELHGWFRFPLASSPVIP